MTGPKSIDLEYVVGHCEEQADQHKLFAAHEGKTAFSSAKDARKRDEHLAKSQMADQLAEHFRSHGEGVLKTGPEVDELARTIDPDAFSAHDALVARVIGEGGVEEYARQVAHAAYGDRMDEACDRAAESLQTAANNPDDSQNYDKGVDDVIRWHEQRAAEAERLEQKDAVPSARQRYAKRAQRHRLYARHIRQDFNERRAARDAERITENVTKEPQLPLSPPDGAGPLRGPERTGQTDEGVPLAVQAAFRRRGEVYDDES